MNSSTITGTLPSTYATSNNLEKKKDASPTETSFNLPYPLPTWPPGSGFATGSINLAGLELCQVSSFSKVWATREGGEQDLGATFFRPQLPSGYSMLGHYCQPNNKPLFGWVLVGKASEGEETMGSLKKPIDYSLVYSSRSSNIKQDGVGYVWLPKPPEGYSAVGYIVTNLPEMPSLEDMMCVRSDLTEPCTKDLLLWEATSGSKIDIYSTKPANIGVQALGVSVGTFMVTIDGVEPSNFACLKNKDSNLAAMPNVSQIEALMQAYSPWVYFHPDEAYLPSSVSWLFSNGALLYKQGDPNPSPIGPTGSNLPQGGNNDGTYWIDLPADAAAKEKVKKGDLDSSVCYLHVKPMLGATFTDIAIWVFYPFNGPAKAKVELVNVSLGRIGEHVGDWEHVTLRISNFNGELWRVFFSEHSGGTWADASELEFYDKNKAVAYASLHGHAFYRKAGLVLQGNSKLGVGIRNDTGKGKGLDVGLRYEVVGAEYLDSIVEPPWLSYTRKWGPKITYDIGKEINKVFRFLPGKLKSALQSLIDKLPNEVLGEEGPTGPKMKDSWNGDEPSKA